MSTNSPVRSPVEIMIQTDPSLPSVKAQSRQRSDPQEGFGMIIGELTMHTVATLPPEATLIEAGLALQAAGAPVLAVVQHGQLLGSVSERDLAVKGCGAGLKPGDAKVLAICDRNPAICPEDMGLSSALDLMRKRGQPWLLVLDHDKRLSGVVSLDALIAVLAGLVPSESAGPEPEYVHRVRGDDGTD
jgi:CBS domain-containing protein